MEILLLLGVALLNVAVAAAIYYKVRQVHLASYRIENNTAENRATYTQVQAYLDLVTLLQPRTPLPPLRGWAASPDFLLIIGRHALKKKPSIVLECSSGASTVVLARCCEISKGGHVFSLEHDPEYAEKTRSLLREQELDGWATVVDAPLVPYAALENRQWYSLDGLQLPDDSVQLLVVDGPPSNTAPMARYPAFPLLEGKFAKKCTIVLDDANRKSESAAVGRWLEEFSGIKLSRPDAEKGCVMLDYQKGRESPSPVF